MKWFIRACVAVTVIAFGAAAWLLGTESGLRWALGFAPTEIEIEGARGTLAGTITAERVAFQGSEARNVALELNLLALATDTVSIDFLRMETLRIQKPQATQPRTPAPPFRIRIADAQVKSLVFEGYEIHDVGAEYSGTASRHEAQAFFGAAGARARVHVVIEDVIKIQAAIQSLNLAVIDPQLPQTDFGVRLDGQGGAAAFAGTLSVVNRDPGPLDRERLPFSRAQAAFSTDYRSVEFKEIKAELHPAGSVSGKGSATLEGATFDIRVAGLDLRGLYSSLRATRLSGALELDLARERQRVKGTLAQEDMSLKADAERRGDEVEIRALHALAGESEAHGSARLYFGKFFRFAADLRLARFDPARFGDYPNGSINGALRGSGDLGGTGSARWEIADSQLLGQSFASKGEARLEKERLTQVDAWARLGANRATAKGSFGGPRDRVAWTLRVPELSMLAAGFEGDIRASGIAGGSWEKPFSTIDAQASRLRLAEALVFERAAIKASGTLEKHEGDISGTSNLLEFKATLRGGWRADAWRGEILALSNAGAYPLELRTPVPLEARADRVVLGSFDAELAGGRAAVESVRWENRRLASNGSISGLPAQWILGALGVAQLAGDLRVDGDWALTATPKLNGKLALRRASGDLAFGDTPLDLSQVKMEARFSEDAVAVSAQIAARVASTRIEGTLAGLAPEAALKLTAEIEAAELRSLTEPLWTQARLSGRIAATLTVAGVLKKPELSGTLRGDALGVEMPPWGIALRDGRVRAELDADRLRITEAHIVGAEGSLSASGTLGIHDGSTTLQWQATQFRLLGRPDRRLVLSGKGSASFDRKRFGLSGELRADSGNFELAADTLPQLEDDVEVAGREKPAARKQMPLPIDLDLKLDLGSRLTLRAYGFDGGVTGRLRVSTGAAGELLAQGRVEALRARFRAYGQELEVDPGMLVFDGPLEAPGLDISAWRRHQQVEAGIHLTGTLQAPRVELISNPPVSDSDKLSWLVLGRAPTEASGADLAVLQTASGAVFGRGGQLPLQRRFAASLGLDELTVRSSGELASNVVALGKRYSDHVYVSFEQAIGTTTEYLVKLDYALTQRISLRGQTGTTSGAGVFYRYSWD